MKFHTIRITAAAILLLAQPAILFAQSGIEPYKIERTGQSGWQFLKINGDARQAALGNSYTALAEGDANSVFGNPAAIVNVKNVDVALNRTNWIADIGYQSIAVVKNFEGIGVVGISIANIDYGDIPETINSPISGENRTETVVTGNTFTATDIAVGITYARSITDRLSVGGSIRWMRESIADVSMNNWSLDIGTLFYTGFRSLRIGFSARNFGPDSHLIGFNEELQSEPQDIKMPLDFRLGVAMDFFDEPESKNLLTVSFDGNHPNDGTEKFRVGVEYTFNKIFSVRAGYKFNYDEENFTFGAGIEYPVYDYKLSVHYAYVDFGILEQVHMFTVGFSL
ncbi:MAG: PorV/PorQ family protein [Bacteroidota bacterium]